MEKGNTEAKLVLLKTCDDAITANMLRSKLENEGIICFLHNEHFSTLMPHYFNLMGSGVRLLVPADQLDMASAVINASNASLQCPQCHSERVVNEYSNSYHRVGLSVMAIVFALPFGNLLNNYICKDCGTEFKKT